MQIGDAINTLNRGTQPLKDAKSLVSGARSTINGAVDTVNEFNKIAGKEPADINKVMTGAGTVKGLGIAGVASSVMAFAVAAKNHDVNGMIGALTTLSGNLGSTLSAFNKLPGAADLLKKLGGPAAIIGGITGAIATLKDAQKHGWDAGKVMNMASSVLSSVAGVAMMVPGGQVVAAAAGAGAAALGLGALAYKYKDQIAHGAKVAAHAVATGAKDVADAVVHGAKDVAHAVNGAENAAASGVKKAVSWLGF